MTGRASVVVAGLGARTAVGLSAPTSAAAVRAGISRIVEHPFVFDGAGDALQVAQVSSLAVDLRGAARLGALVGPAVSEALEPLSSVHASMVVPVFIGLPLQRPGRSRDAEAIVIRRVLERFTLAGLSPGAVRFIETGHAAGTMALQAGWELLRSGAADLVLCGAVDSYLDAETMNWLAATGQVHGADENPWGFTPGEAAGFVLLTSARFARRLHRPAVLEVSIIATTRETKLIGTNAVSLGEGLAALFKALAAGLPSGCRVDHLICDMNGQPYRADEYGFAIARTAEFFRHPSAFATPASNWGDVGAASGPLFLALADAAVRRRYNRGPLLGAFTSAETGERCGFVVQALGAGPIQGRM